MSEIVREPLRDLLNDPFAKVERGVALVDGLFRPLRDSKKRPDRLYTCYEGERYDLEFRGHEALDILDESVLWAVISESHRARPLNEDPNGEVGQYLRTAQQLSGMSATRRSCAVVTTENALLALLGLADTGGNHKSLKCSIKRLSAVTLWVRDKVTGEEGSMLLMTPYLKTKEGKVYFALHHALAEAILGDARFIRLSLRERNLLASDAAKAAHRWLTAWLYAAPASGRISLSKLEVHVYGSALEDGPAKRQRFLKLRRALEEIHGLPGWIVAPLSKRGDITYAVYRPDPRVALDVAEGRVEPPQLPQDMSGWLRSARMPLPALPAAIKIADEERDLLGPVTTVRRRVGAARRGRPQSTRK